MVPNKTEDKMFILDVAVKTKSDKRKKTKTKNRESNNFGHALQLSKANVLLCAHPARTSMTTCLKISFLNASCPKLIAKPVSFNWFLFIPWSSNHCSGFPCAPFRGFSLLLWVPFKEFEGPDDNHKRKIHLKKCAQNEKVHLNKFFWRVSFGLLTRARWKEGQNSAWTFRKKIA